MKTYESHYQLIIYLLFRLIGANVRAEYATSNGYMDVLLQTPEYVYILELKIRDTAEVALEQIREKGYDKPFIADSRKVFRIGISFDIRNHRIGDFIIE